MDGSYAQFSSPPLPSSTTDGTSPSLAAASGSEPRPSDGIRTRPPTTARLRTADHILTAEEVVQRFRQAGVPRSIRRVTEYCARGDLDAFRDPDERRWYVTPASVQELIGHFQELQSRHRATADIRTVPPAAAADGSAPPPTADDGHRPNPTVGSGLHPQLADLPPTAVEKIRALEDEVTGLKISNQAKDIVIGQLKEERVSHITLLQKRAFTIGRLKEKLRLLAAPAPTTVRAQMPDVRAHAATSGIDHRIPPSSVASEPVEVADPAPTMHPPAVPFHERGASDLETLSEGTPAGKILPQNPQIP